MALRSSEIRNKPCCTQILDRTCFSAKQLEYRHRLNARCKQCIQRPEQVKQERKQRESEQLDARRVAVKRTVDGHAVTHLREGGSDQPSDVPAVEEDEKQDGVPRRIARAEQVLQSRTSRFLLVVEECVDNRNQQAIIRTAEAMGIQ